MPFLASATVIGHLYRTVKVKQNAKGSYAMISFYTKDKEKNKDATFTSWSGFVHGPQAKWLAAGKKNSPVVVSGTIAMEKRVDDAGKEHVSIHFTRVNEARLLEREEESAPVAQAPVSKPAGGAAGAPKSGPGDDEPPFLYLNEWGI
jgi:single-stranded DNA-binding protein